MDKKPDFSIEGDDTYTSIIFPEGTTIQSSEISKYKYNNLIKNEILPNNKIRFSIPSKKINSFSTDNKIVIDVAIYKPIASSFVIEELKVVPEKTDVEAVYQEAKQEYIKNFNELQSTIDIEDEKTSIEVVENKPNKTKGRSTSLGFSWTERVGISIFKRDEFLWIVFDSKKIFNTKEIADTTKGFIEEIMQVPNPQASILRLKLKKNTDVNVRKEGLLWIVDLFNQSVDRKITNFITQTQYESKNDVYLFIPTNQASDVVSTYDPEFGDILIFATVFDVGLGYSQKYEYPEFNILPSIQGLVVETFTDDLVMTRNNSGLTIKNKNRGLNISPNLELLKQQSNLLEEKEWIKNLSSELPMELVNENFITTVDKLKDNIKNAKTQDKDNAKIELAKYYLLKGLGFEAGKIYNDLIIADSPVIKAERFHGQLGIAYFLMGEYEKAVKEFEYGRLQEFKEGILWKVISQSALSADKEKNALMLKYIPVIRDYPTEIKDKIAKVGVESSVFVSDDIAAQGFLSIIENSNSSRKYSAFVDYYGFEIFAIQGYGRNSQMKLIDAAKSTSQKYSAFARRKYAILEFKSGKRSLEDAVSELERLKFVWGDKSFKITLLEDLYNIYYSTGDYYNSFVKMNLLYKNYDDLSKKEKIKQNMIQLFENIYINNHEGALSPTRAIALYDDFEWVAKESYEYNEIVLNLADRLVALDLIDRAYRLLNIHIDNKDLSDLEKGKIASRLGLINIFRNNDKEAILLIDESNYPNLPQYIISHHNLIKAQALVNLKKYEDALEALKNDNSYKSVILQNEIYIMTGKWSKSADTIKRLVKNPKKGETIDDEQARIVLDWIISLKKAKKETVVVFIRDKFKPHFENSKFLSTFNMLTNELNPTEVDIRNIDSIINDITHFSKFIKSYNDFLGSNSISQADVKKQNVK